MCKVGRPSVQHLQTRKRKLVYWFTQRLVARENVLEVDCNAICRSPLLVSINQFSVPDIKFPQYDQTNNNKGWGNKNTNGSVLFLSEKFVEEKNSFCIQGSPLWVLTDLANTYQLYVGYFSHKKRHGIFKKSALFDPWSTPLMPNKI